MRNKYFGNWGCREDVAKDFEEDEINFPCEGAIHFAGYYYEDYSGNAFVLFENNGELFLVEGSHCSCNGLESSWCPEKTTWAALRMKKFWYFNDATQKEVEALIASHLPS